MQSLVLRTLGGLVAAGIGLSVAATPAAAAENSTFRLPAAAADTSTFRLSVGGAVAHGTHARMMSAPERPVPPFRIDGTLTGRTLFRCAVVQVGASGPADGLEWRTIARQCGPGRTTFRTQSSYLFRAVKPPVRLCIGWTPSQAERGRQCDTYRPPADR